jgi:hypothetical protein
MLPNWEMSVNFANFNRPGPAGIDWNAQISQVPCGSKGFMAFYMQQCIHYNEETVLKIFKVSIEGLQKYAKRCNAQALIMVTGCHAQSKVLDARFPHQAWDNAQKINEKIQNILPPGVVFMDYFKMSKLAQTSDGYHYLSNINLEKADAMLRVLELFSEAGQASGSDQRKAHSGTSLDRSK